MAGVQIRPCSQVVNGSRFKTRSPLAQSGTKLPQLRYILQATDHLYSHTFLLSLHPHCIHIPTVSPHIVERSSYSHHGRNRYILCVVPDLSIQTECFFTPGVPTNVPIFWIGKR